MDELFKEFISTYNKKYTDDEYNKRFAIFSRNIEFINSHNSENNDSSFKLDVNEFADMTTDEFSSTYLAK